MAARRILLLLLVVHLVRVRAVQPMLELLSVSPAHLTSLEVHGQDGTAYLLEISTDLTGWGSTTATPFHTTNGLALLSHISQVSDRTVFYRVRVANSPTNAPIVAHLLADFATPSVVTPDGGSAELTLPDLRQVTLTIPPGCVTTPQEFSVTVVTNLENLLFAQGALAAVRIEPEGFVLSGAASLEIELPASVNLHQIASFSVNNDGSGFHLFPDRILTNRVLIPITRFATYGTAVASLEELLSVANNTPGPSPSVSGRVQALTLEPECPRLPMDFSSDTSQFIESSVQCFPELVNRALEVRASLNHLLRCNFLSPMASLLGIERQKQLLGFEDILALEEYVKTNVCAVYSAMIEPLWPEARVNCPLNTVLLDFMLGFERQLQLLGVTKGPPCASTLSQHLADACQGARECLREIKACCAFQNHRGFKKQQEAFGIVRQFELLGYNCFPQGRDDPDVQAVLEVCLTNLWLGTLSVREFTNINKTTQTVDTRIVEKHDVDVTFLGSVYQSFDAPDPFGSGRLVSLQLVGDATIKVHDQVISRREVKCKLGGTAVNYSENKTDTIGVKHASGDANQANAFGSYGVTIQLRAAQKTYQIDFLGAGLNTMKGTDFSYSYDAPCQGDVLEDSNLNTGPAPLGLFPTVANTIIRSLPDPNTTSIKGSYQGIDPNIDPPTTIVISWDFQRRQTAPQP